MSKDSDEVLALRNTVQRYVQDEVLPEVPRWEEDGEVPRAAWQRAGELGLLCPSAPSSLGGGDASDFRLNAAIIEEMAITGGFGVGVTLHSDIMAPYLINFGTEQQQRRWLPPMTSGDAIGAIALTEPEAGSDLAAMKTTATPHHDGYTLNGTKSFISNGMTADTVLVAAKTDPAAGRNGVSLLVVDAETEGFRRASKLQKIGLHSQDTCELVFENVQVSEESLLGERNKGFDYLRQALAQERLCIALSSGAIAERALDATIAYCRERSAFGKPISNYQNTRFELADMATRVAATRSFLNECVTEHNADADGISPTKGAMAKLWASETVADVTDRCLQLFGGYGYTREYPISRWFVDARATRLYAGTSEIMKEIIGRDMTRN